MKERENILKQMRLAEMDNDNMQNRGGSKKGRQRNGKHSLEAEARGGKAMTREDESNEARASIFAMSGNSNTTAPEGTMRSIEQGGSFPFEMGKEIPWEEVRMNLSQSTETGTQTNVTREGEENSKRETEEQWNNCWRCETSWGRSGDDNKGYWGLGKPRMMSRRESTMVQN